MLVPATTIPPPPPPPPPSPYGTFDGSLFQYNRNLVAFESSPPSCQTKVNDDTVYSSNKCILIGGLSDGLIPTPYTSLLQKSCHELGWSLVQPIFSSSYLGFGNGSLERDTNEMDQLLWYLMCHRSAKQFALVGHSTGCQNSIHFLKYGRKDLVDCTKFIALQAPVSDREGAAATPDYDKNLKKAQLLVNTRGEDGDGGENEMMPRNAFWAPITAKRFLDLHEKGGADDFFSSDYTDEELNNQLQHVGNVGKRNGLRLLTAFSGSDEYVPKHVDSKLLLERLCTAMNTDCVHDDQKEDRKVAIPLYLPNANHNLSQGVGDANMFVDKVAEYLKVLTHTEADKPSSDSST